MIAFTVESFGGAGGTVVVLDRFFAPVPVIMQNRPGTTPSIRRLQRSMKMLPAIKIPVLALHQTIKRVARRVGILASFLVPHAPLHLLVAKVERFFLHHTAQMLHRPFTQTTDALPHDSLRFGIVNLPNSLAKIEKVVLLLAAFSNSKPRMKETPDDRDR